MKRPGSREPGTQTRRTTNSFYEGGNDLCSGNDCTRAQIVTFLYRSVK